MLSRSALAGSTAALSISSAGIVALLYLAASGCASHGLGIDLGPGGDLGAAADLALADGQAPTDDASGACSPEIQALAAEMYGKPGQSCTVVVRLTHDTRVPLGFQLFCGHYAQTTEASARGLAQMDSGYGATATMLNPALPTDEYVFFASPGDFGGAAAVSVRTGVTAFGGSIVWSGAGDITYPKTWRDPRALGSGCPASGGIRSRRGYDLVGGVDLAPALVDAAVATVADTAVPAALWRGGYVFDAVVLRYPRSVGQFNPATAEWIVIVNGGWLE